MNNVLGWDLIRLTYGTSMLPPAGYLIGGFGGFFAALGIGAVLCIVDPRPRKALQKLAWYRWCMAVVLMVAVFGVVLASFTQALWSLLLWAACSVGAPVMFAPFIEDSGEIKEVKFRRG